MGIELSLFAPAKINLGLWIRCRRPDGYHEIETLMVPVPDLRDQLTFRIIDGPEPRLIISGISIAGNAEDNLCLRAWRLLRTEFGERVASLSIHLEKHIPTGAGLGGGSSDAAACLRAIDELSGLGLGMEGLHRFAVSLGADVPFFLQDEAMLATGIGEVLEPVALSLSFRIELRTSDAHSDTALAYRELDLSRCTSSGSLREAFQQPIALWPELITNDFEAGLFRRFPQLQATKERLYAEGAFFALMSGSGSAVYGLFGE